MKVPHTAALRHAKRVGLCAGTFGNTPCGVLNDSLKAASTAWRPAPSGQVVPFDHCITIAAQELRFGRQVSFSGICCCWARAVPACEAAQPSGRWMRRPSAACALCATAAARRMAAAFFAACAGSSNGSLFAVLGVLCRLPAICCGKTESVVVIGVSGRSWQA